MPDSDFYPQTAREALFEIRRLYAGGRITDDVIALLKRIDEIAELGLDRREPMNLGWGDDIADRLAEAHAVLRELDKKGVERRIARGDLEEVAGKAREAMALPPQLEAVVERRIGPAS